VNENAGEIYLPESAGTAAETDVLTDNGGIDADYHDVSESSGTEAAPEDFPVADNAAMYAAYCDIIADDYYSLVIEDDNRGLIIRRVISGGPESLRLTSGGLLDFDRDGQPELILIYESDYYEKACIAYSFDGIKGSELFESVLSNGGNWGNRFIVEKDGAGAVCEYIFLHPEGTGPHVMGGSSYSYQVFEDGDLTDKFGYYLNNYVTGEVMSETVDHQIWEIYRNGETTASGTAKPGAAVQRIEDAKTEAEAEYGGEWAPLPIDELLELLNPGGGYAAQVSQPRELYEVKPDHLSVIGKSYSDIKILLGEYESEFLYHAEYYVASPDSEVTYSFQGSVEEANWIMNDTDVCEKVVSGLKSIVSGFENQTTIADFTKNLKSAAGYEMRGSGGTSWYVSGERYAVVYLDNGRRLEINMDCAGDNVYPYSYVWLR
jgi:hypothetical protein